MAKKKTPKPQREYQQEVQTILDQEIDLQEQYSKAETFVTNNRGVILGLVGLVGLLLAAIFFFRSVYIPGQNDEASAAMFQAEKYFAQDSFKLALNGDGTADGFLDIIDSYSGMTDAANLAQYYAGVSYLNLGQFEDALSHLGNFSSNDEVVSSMALGAMGDAHMELGNNDQGINYYKKAARNSANGYTAPMFFMKAGAALEKAGNFSDAASMYKEIVDNYSKDEYVSNGVIRNAEKYLSRAESRK